ncbi:3-hydroxybutyrate dehydrogenase [Actinoplanes sp. OR16]|uniref:SDR family NAD(P)-dependent oxidoreductase n=1 Tax=Actinoplanes sp. OR16 TaxID=946334 RepID=UPI000F6F39B8|nr:SDR family oxidoreductase [Actinoplanes sp. OR16]BBH69331.1 3-hydroxybutyrate dehydrogenase [Actinoplanes sp. OR16]
MLVTGGTGTLGEAVVLAFAKAGHHTFFQYFRNDTAAARLTETLGATGFKIDFSGDFSLPVSDFDILINCAGINVSEDETHAVDIAAWDRMLRVNVTVPFLLSQLVLPGMLRRGWGRIVNIGSIYSLRGATRRAPYVASKHALSGLTKTLALESANTGVTCNEIRPSAVDSQMINRIAKIRSELRGTTVEDVLAEYRSMNPFGRMATAAEVASTVLFLAGPEAGFINGASIPVDGGQIV